MTASSLSNFLDGDDKLGSSRLHARLDRDELVGRIKEKRHGVANLSKGFDQRLGSSKRFGYKIPKSAPGTGDPRQRVVVKIHFFGHGGGGGAALKAHARYIGRDDAGERGLEEADPERADEDKARAHGTYLERSDERSGFYDALTEGVDGAARMAVWAREDRRHFRLIIAAENGAELKDFRPFIREVMESAERALGTRLEWVAIDHFDTSQPHTHVVLRGRRANGRSLFLPRDYVKHGLREAARTIATQRLGKRTRDDERQALQREARAHRPTRLDRVIEQRLGRDRELHIGRLARAGDDPAFAAALKTRARELQRLGLAAEVRRNVLAMRADWRERLTAMELHLDIRKNLMRARAQPQPARAGPALPFFGGLLR